MASAQLWLAARSLFSPLASSLLHSCLLTPSHMPPHSFIHASSLLHSCLFDLSLLPPSRCHTQTPLPPSIPPPPPLNLIPPPPQPQSPPHACIFPAPGGGDRELLAWDYPVCTWPGTMHTSLPSSMPPSLPPSPPPSSLACCLLAG